ncbi:MAG: hypothetical protein GXP26_09770 [Planctomycetes bacterium]|nr:hypothetical protein [Planctomycetota bacterium]
MPTSDSIKRLSTLAALVVCCLVVTWSLWPKVVSWNQQQLASRLAAKIKAADEDNTRIPLRQLASLGTAALHPLVEASTSERSKVAEQARLIINEQFESWRLQAEANRHFDLATPTTTLAEALADRIDKYGPRGKQWAESLALRLIVLAETIPANKAPAMLEDCSRILAAVPASGPRLRNLPTTPVQTSSASPRLPAIPNMPLSAFAVPSETVLNTPTLKPNHLEQQTPVYPADPSTVSIVPRTSDQLPPPNPSNWSPEWRNEITPLPSAKPLATAPLQPAVPPLPTSTNQPKKASHLFLDIPSPAEMDQQIKRLRQKTSQELVQLLPRDDLFKAGPIRAVLRERGLTDAEMNLTKQFSSAQVGDRLQLVDDLSVLPAATARRWLRWLLKDKNAEVRLRALSAIATTADPGLYNIARDLAINDQDPRIAKLASRIMEDTR